MTEVHHTHEAATGESMRDDEDPPPFDAGPRSGMPPTTMEGGMLLMQVLEENAKLREEIAFQDGRRSEKRATRRLFEGAVQSAAAYLVGTLAGGNPFSVLAQAMGFGGPRESGVIYRPSEDAGENDPLAGVPGLHGLVVPGFEVLRVEGGQGRGTHAIVPTGYADAIFSAMEANEAQWRAEFAVALRKALEERNAATGAPAADDEEGGAA